MAVAPTWEINDVVYLETSARIGFLEAVKVSNVVRARGRWFYTINVNQRPPAETTVGGFNDLKQGRLLFFDEAELIGLQEALLLARNSLQLKLSKINALIDQHFPEGTDS
jgi:hypothetical protein